MPRSSFSRSYRGNEPVLPICTRHIFLFTPCNAQYCGMVDRRKAVCTASVSAGLDSEANVAQW